MRNTALILFTFFSISTTPFRAQVPAEPLAAYQFITRDGQKVGFEEAIELMAGQDVVLFGEYHDHAMVHWLQLKTAEALSAKKEIVLGGEMFETDNQLIINEYLSGLVPDRRFEAEAKLWPNYKTDYRPLLQLAKSLHAPFIATNVPRRYAGVVSQYGLDTLSSLSREAQLLMAPLPILFSMETPGYPEMAEMMHGGGMGAGFDPTNFVKAQALKDATMAHRILINLEKGKLFIHFNGDYHSADFGGIYWYLRAQDETLKIMSVKTAYFSDEPDGSENLSGGDIILLVPEDFTKTH